MLKFLKSSLASSLIVALIATTSPIAAYAKLIGTDEVVTAQTFGHHDRAQLAAILDRADVAAMLEEHGVTVDQAKARLAAMTEDEVQQLAATIDTAPAGSSSIIGVLFTIFVILLVTDILGFTKVFPFTRSIR